jgi:hypothetical protein
MLTTDVRAHLRAALGLALFAGSLACAAPASAAEFDVSYGLSVEEFQAIFDQKAAEGWAPRTLSIYPTTNGFRYAAVWGPSEGPSEARALIPAAEIDERLEALRGAGQMPVALAAAWGPSFTEVNVSNYGFVSGPAIEGWTAVTGVGLKEFQQIFNTRSADGERLAALSTASQQGSTTYSAVWVPNDGYQWAAYANLSVVAAGKKTTEMAAQGLVPIRVAATMPTVKGLVQLAVIYGKSSRKIALKASVCGDKIASTFVAVTQAGQEVIDIQGYERAGVECAAILIAD